MLAELMWRLVIVAAVTVPVDDVVGRAAARLWQLLVRLGSDLGDRFPPDAARGRLETRSTCLFPRNLMNCYHCLPFSLQRVVYLAVGKFTAFQRPLLFNMTLLCFALRLAASSPCFPCLSATVQGVVSCPVAASCCICKIIHEYALYFKVILTYSME